MDDTEIYTTENNTEPATIEGDTELANTEEDRDSATIEDDTELVTMENLVNYNTLSKV